MQENGKRVLVTGSSRGIGRAVALQLARDGYTVLVHCAGQTEKAQQTAEEIRAAGGCAAVLRADLCRLEEIDRLAAEMGTVDALVLNASVQYRQKWEQITVEECTRQLTCNFIASMRLIQAAVPHMRAQRWGRIVTIGSVQEAKPHPDMLVYSASKAAQTNMARSLAVQLAAEGITVNNVAPGVIDTDRNAAALADPVYAAKVAATIPAGFWGQPADCAGAVSLLCSDRGRYITGQSLYVDGGKSVL